MLLIGNGRVITRDPDRPYLENGAVVTEGAKIIAVGEDGALRKTYPDARYVDATDIIQPTSMKSWMVCGGRSTGS